MGQHTNLYPRIIMQFIRVAPLSTNYGFELVTWWQDNADVRKDFRTEIEESRPTPKELEIIHKKGSYMIIDRYTK